jgi:4-hydroxy-3-methylbut-2-enyl diphosphate reductase
VSASLVLLAPMRLEARAARAGAPALAIRRTGMGARRAQRAGEQLRHDGTATALVVGLCGALDPALRPGDVVLASELRGPDGASIPCPDPSVLAGALRAQGLRVHVGPIASSTRLVTGGRRAPLARTGALAVDMESAWIAAAAGATPVATLRVVLDTPDHELRRPWRTVTNLLRARAVLREACRVVAAWAEVLGDREVLLAGPRASCAGVVRAVAAVREALQQYGAPLYVRKQIVHNARVVAELERDGAVFVEEVHEVPKGATLVFSAHGVSPAVREQARRRGLTVIDATCPLVAKVHAEARRFAADGFDIVLIGHEEHEEVEGTVGEAPEHIQVAATAEDLDGLTIADPERVAYLTQTTLAVDETAELVASLRERYPAAVGPGSDDICYATQNRQDAVRALAGECDVLIVVGSSNSSNSRRLVEVAARAGSEARLVESAQHIPLDLLAGARRIGVTAGASAPEALVQEVVDALGGLGHVSVSERVVRSETLHFKLPVPQNPTGA